MADLDYDDDDDDDPFTAKVQTMSRKDSGKLHDDGKPGSIPEDGVLEEELQTLWRRASGRLTKMFQLGNVLTDCEKKNLPLESATLTSTTWVSVTSKGLLCIACKRAGMTTPWAKGEGGKESKDLSRVFKSGYLKRHETSSGHKAAVCQMLLLDDSPGAPPADEFRTLLLNLQAGRSRINCHGSYYSDKVALMTWVLHEALLDMERDEMSKACTISLARDARRARLLIKYGMCTEAFTARAGVLGMSLGGGDRGGDIVRQTRKLIRRFCTKFANRPRWFKGPEPQFNESLFDHITSKIEIIMSDSAANEILAGLGFKHFVYKSFVFRYFVIMV